MTPDDAAAHLRSERNLRALTPEEEGNPVSVLPAGIYGFTYSPSFELTPLFASKRFRNFEYHKLADGSVELVGYVTAVEAEHVRSGVGGFEVQLYPDPTAESNQLASLPMDRLARTSQRQAREGGSAYKLRVE